MNAIVKVRVVNFCMDTKCSLMYLCFTTFQGTKKITNDDSIGHYEGSKSTKNGLIFLGLAAHFPFQDVYHQTHLGAAPDTL